METLFNPQSWAFPGHGEPQGMLALAILIIGGCLTALTAASTLKSRLLPAVVRTTRYRRPPD
jgi:hypothetical protein